MKHYILDTYNITSLIGLPSEKDKGVYFLVTLVRYFSYRYPSYRISLVLDGVFGQDFMLPENVELINSGYDKKADDIIKDMIDTEQNKPNCIVVSSDLEVFSYARISACKAMKSDMFLDRLQQVYVEKTGSKSPNSEKPMVVTSKEKQRLMNEFDKELTDESFLDNYKSENKKAVNMPVTANDFIYGKPKKKGKPGKSNTFNASDKPYSLSDEEVQELMRLFGENGEFSGRKG